jgi:hypothetical protein
MFVVEIVDFLQQFVKPKERKKMKICGLGESKKGEKVMQ